MKYLVKHITEYHYQFPATLCHNVICQGPGDSPHQVVREYVCSIDPEPSMQQERKDFFDNPLIYFSIERTHSDLKVETESEVEVLMPPWASLDPLQTQPWEEVREWLHSTEAMNDTRQFYLESPYVSFHPEIYDFAKISFSPGRAIMAATLDLCSRIYHEFSFTPGFTEISTPLQDVFKHRKGVCQDFAHLALSCLRSLGLSARYVSGYIETLPPPGKTKLVGADASHAWIAVYIPALGWVEFDATNNLLVKDQHIRAAYGRDFSDVVPLKGIVYSNGLQEMKVSVDIRRS
jgi:transglutaminase-like putative cysteine protease